MIASTRAGKIGRGLTALLAAGCLAAPLMTAAPALAADTEGNLNQYEYTYTLSENDTWYTSPSPKLNDSPSMAMNYADSDGPIFAAVTGANIDVSPVIMDTNESKVDSVQLYPGDVDTIRSTVHEDGWPQAQLKIYVPGGTPANSTFHIVWQADTV